MIHRTNLRSRARLAPCLTALALALALPPARVQAQGAAAPRAAAAPASTQLSVRIRGLRNDRGHVAVALFDSAERFPDQGRALLGQLVRSERGTATAVFRGLAPGVYAIAVLHDENDNAKMDFNFLGMPREGYGFSNDASAPFGPPSFAASAFRLLARPSVVSVKIRYLL